MAINYNAGFLPQGLYNNIGNALQRGYDADLERRRNLATGLGSMLGAYGKMTVDRGNKAQEQVTKQYEQRRKDLEAKMKLADQGNPELMRQFNTALTDLDKQYNSAIEGFSGSGFLGTALGRDTDMLKMGGVTTPGIGRGQTAEDATRRGDIQKFRAQQRIRAATEPQIAGANETAKLQAVANETIRQYNDPTFKSMKEEDRENRINEELKKIEARGDIQLANTQLQVAAQEATRQERHAEAKRLNDFRMKLLEKESENRLAMSDQENARLERRYELENELLQKKADGKSTSSLTPKQALELRGKIQEETMAELGIFEMADLADDPDKKAEYDALLRKKNNEIASLYSGYKFGDPTSQQVPIPKPEDVGVGAPAKRQPRLGEGFITPSIIEGYQGQLDSLLENADRLTNADGKPIFRDLQKRVDALQVESEKINKQIRTAQTQAEKNAAIEKLNSIVPQINKLNTEMFQRTEQRRKGQRTLGMQLNAVPGRAMNYIPPGA